MKMKVSLTILVALMVLLGSALAFSAGERNFGEHNEEIQFRAAIPGK